MQAGMNFNQKTPKESIMKMFGTKEFQRFSKLNSKYKSKNPVYDNIVPLKFDSRKQWLHCNIINMIQNQGYCGSSWVGDINIYGP